jgi:hypothetical protein
VVRTHVLAQGRTQLRPKGRPSRPTKSERLRLKLRQQSHFVCLVKGTALLAPHRVVNLAGRFDVRGGVERRLGAAVLRRLEEDGQVGGLLPLRLLPRISASHATKAQVANDICMAI